MTDTNCFEEAQKHQVWKDAMCEEINSILKNGTWKLCSLPVNKNVIGVKWIFKTKYKSTGKV